MSHDRLISLKLRCKITVVLLKEQSLAKCIGYKEQSISKNAALCSDRIINEVGNQLRENRLVHEFPLRIGQKPNRGKQKMSELKRPSDNAVQDM